MSSITVHPFVKAEFAPSILVIGPLKRLTPLKTNREPENEPLKKDFPIGHHYFQVFSFEVFPKFASKLLVEICHAQLDRYHIHDLQGSNQLPGGVFLCGKWLLDSLRLEALTETLRKPRFSNRFEAF